MNYATWKLDFTNPDYGTGPEQRIAELGFTAEAAWTIGEITKGGTILGYVSEELDPAELTNWEFTNITQAQALEFCLAVNPNAYLLPLGKIVAPSES